MLGLKSSYKRIIAGTKPGTVHKTRAVGFEWDGTRVIGAFFDLGSCILPSL
jgi:hypothetical protein